MPSKPVTYKLIGTPFSTFTRTIALGLHYKNIPFEQVIARGSRPLAFQYHPFGYLPTLVIQYEDGKSINLAESQAIARYTDRVAPTPSLELPLSAKEAGVLEEKMWEFVSLAGSFGYPILEQGVIKPYVAALDEGILSSHAVNHEEESVVTAKKFLAKMEALMLPSTKFAFGEVPTWADFFLYPLLADLRAIPAWEVAGPRLVNWMLAMDDLEAVEQTKVGTLALGGRPPNQ